MKINKNILFLCIVLGTVLALNCMLSLLLPVSNPSEITSGSIIISYQKEKVNAMSPGGVVFVGDSSLGNSLDARTLGKILDKRCYNLSLVASYKLVADYYLIKYVLDRVKPKAIVVSCSFSLIEQGDIYGRSEKKLARIFDEHRDPFLNFILHNVYMIRNQAVAKEILFQERSGMNSNFLSDYKITSESSVSLDMYGENDYPLQGKPIRLESNYMAPIMKHYSYKFMDKWLLRCSALCKEHGVKMYFMYNPVVYDIYSENVEYYEMITSHMLEMASESDIIFLDLNNPTFPSKHIGDTVYHLNPSMKQHYTQWLGKVLSQSPLCGFSIDHFNQSVRDNPLQWP